MTDADIIKPIVFYRAKRISKSRVERGLTACGAIGDIDRERGFTILTNGAFSMIDAVRHVLTQTGAAHLHVTTWIPGVQELCDLYDLKQGGAVLSLRFLLDYGFRANKPKRAALVTELFGEQCVVESRNHAKVVLIRNEKWDFCLRGSLNLNGNFRCENLDGDNDAAMCDAFAELWESHATRFPVGFGQTGRESGAAYRELMAENKQAPRRGGKAIENGGEKTNGRDERRAPAMVGGWL